MASDKLNLKQLNNLIDNKPIKEIKKLICGELLGSGVDRSVYILKQNENYVVKFERNMKNGSFANACEWRNFIDNQETWLAKYLAPCVMITESSQFLIQKRAYHKRRKEYPKYIPVVFTDLKLTNFGWIDDQFVCVDYVFFRNTGCNNNKYRYAKWWNLKIK